MEEVAKDAKLGLLVRHALAAGGGLALGAVAGEALVGGHPAGALQIRVRSNRRCNAYFSGYLLCGEAAR